MNGFRELAASKLRSWAIIVRALPPLCWHTKKKKPPLGRLGLQVFGNLEPRLGICKEKCKLLEWRIDQYVKEVFSSLCRSVDGDGGS